MNKNTILVNRRPLPSGSETILFHNSLIQLSTGGPGVGIGDSTTSGSGLFFFLLPHEAIERKKRWLKDRRRELLEHCSFYNQPKNKFDIS